MRGPQFAISTWVVAEVFRLSAAQIADLGGGSGILLPATLAKTLAPSRDLREALAYHLAPGVLILVPGTVFGLLRSRRGISPEAAFSANDWMAFVIFIVVIAGIGTLVFFPLRETMADLGTAYLIALGLVAIAVMLKAPAGFWGGLRARIGLELFPLSYRVVKD